MGFIKGKGVFVILSIIFAIIFYINFVIGAVYPTNGTDIYACGIIEEPGVYTLIQSINKSGTCLYLWNESITLNLNGSSIIGYGTGKGINAINKDNILIGNGTIYNFDNGIYFEDNSDNKISNIILDSNKKAIYFKTSSNNFFQDFIITNSVNQDIYFETNSPSGKTINNTFLNSSFDVSKIIFNNNSNGGNIELIKKGYLDINVMNSSENLPNATVEIYNSSGNLESFFFNKYFRKCPKPISRINIFWWK